MVYFKQSSYLRSLFLSMRLRGMRSSFCLMLDLQGSTSACMAVQHWAGMTKSTIVRTRLR